VTKLILVIGGGLLLEVPGAQLNLYPAGGEVVFGILRARRDRASPFASARPFGFGCWSTFAFFLRIAALIARRFFPRGSPPDHLRNGRSSR
jgi:hypothetical protein